MADEDELPEDDLAILELRTESLNFRGPYIFRAEGFNIRGTEKRQRACNALIAIATEFLEQKIYGHHIWAAVRRFCSMTPVEELDKLLPFLENEDIDAANMQVALQGIRNCLVPKREEAANVPESVKKRVEVIARRDWGDEKDPKIGALRMNAYVTGRLLGIEGLKRSRLLFTEQRELLGMPTDVKPWE